MRVLMVIWFRAAPIFTPCLCLLSLPSLFSNCHIWSCCIYMFCHMNNCRMKWSGSKSTSTCTALHHQTIGYRRFLDVYATMCKVGDSNLTIPTNCYISLNSRHHKITTKDVVWCMLDRARHGCLQCDIQDSETANPLQQVFLQLMASQKT